MDSGLTYNGANTTAVTMTISGGSTWNKGEVLTLTASSAQFVYPATSVVGDAIVVTDTDGTIYRLMPEDRVGRHAIGLNHVSIGVENVGDGKRWPMTAAQVAANGPPKSWATRCTRSIFSARITPSRKRA